MPLEMPATACRLCGRAEVVVESWNADRSVLVSSRTIPVPSDYPYCYTCHYSGQAQAHTSADLLAGIHAVTGTAVEIWQTGGGTMTGAVSLSADRNDLWAYFGIVYDDEVECAGHLSLQLWAEGADRYMLSQHELWGNPVWLSELLSLWGEALSKVNPVGDDMLSYGQVVEWFRLVWGDTVRVVFENQDEWDRDEEGAV